MSAVIQQKPIAIFSGYMEKLKPQMALALPKHLSADRMARLAMTAFSTNAELQNCTFESIAASIMTAVQLGLEPGVNGAGYLIPYKTTCTFVPGWKGLVDLVARSGRGTVYTGVIYNDQRYEYRDGARRDLSVLNETSSIDPDDITHTYAVGWVKGADMPIIELWSTAKLIAHRNKYNKVGSRHYSFKDWEMYARKIPLLQVLKYMPASIELSMAIDVAQAADSGLAANIIDGIIINQDDNKPYNASQSGIKDDDPQDNPYYTMEMFEKEKDRMSKYIEDGNSAQGIIDTKKTKYTLNKDVVDAILALETKVG